MDYLFHYLYYIRLFIIGALTSFYCRGLLRLKKVELGPGSKFYGIPSIYKFPGSSIKMGRNIEIRTAKISNFIGINRRTTISTHSEQAKIMIGDNCGMSAAIIGAKEFIQIGDSVMIGANVLITDFDWHSINPTDRKHGASSGSKPISISDNVFIGYSATILKGVTIGENSVIGANSVVTKSIPANVIAGGNPCRVLTQLKF